jgi:membrane peptidoglycan carboxypeptidase
LAGSFVAFLVLSIVAGVLLSGLAIPAVTIAGAATKGGINLFDEMPADLQFGSLPQQSNIFAADGSLIAQFYDQNRVVVSLENMSPWLQKAIVAVEDKRFWTHNGVDGQGMLRAVYINLSSQGSPGASTITQQVVKNTLVQAAEALPEPDRTKALKSATEVSLSRKLLEARYALNLEAYLASKYGRNCTADPKVDCGKEAVLQQYLNIAQFGQNVYGVETASQLYFGHSAKEDTALEAATIVGITKNPFAYDPIHQPIASQDRRDTVLLTMRQQDMITQDEYNQYVATPLADTLHINRPKVSCSAAVDAPFFCDYVTRVLIADPAFGGKGEAWLKQGVNIYTTLDVAKQRIANDVLRRTIPQNDPSGFANAMVSLDPKTGAILVMAQDTGYDATTTPAPGTTAINYSTDKAFGGSRGFSPGSTFKPIVLATWLTDGHGLDEVISADKRAWPSNSWTACGAGAVVGGKPWDPANADGNGSDQMTALSATQGSVNTAYAAMTHRLDLCHIRDMAANLGFQRADGAPFEVVPSATLGTQNASPLTMAGVAQVFANDGVKCQQYAITKVETADGTLLGGQTSSCKQVISQAVARGVAYGMQQVMLGGTGAGLQLAGRRPSAGKTGTAEQYIHGWFMGFTPQLVTATWEGNPDHDVKQRNITLGGHKYPTVFGATISGVNWKRFMDAALAGQPNLPLNGRPAGLGSWKGNVPDVVGQAVIDAKHAINDQAYLWSINPVQIYSDIVPAGSVVSQYPPAGTSPSSSSTVEITLARSTLPDWWTTWPHGWNPCVAPSDWWGSSWPPSGFSSAGWSYATCGAHPHPTPSPTP